MGRGVSRNPSFRIHHSLMMGFASLYLSYESTRINKHQRELQQWIK